MSHTPAPWEADVNECAKVRDSHGALLASCNHLEIYGRRDSDTVAANARLIAAAPEMLDLLKQATRRWIDAARAQKYWTPQEKDDLRRIDAAIAKATGGPQ